MELVDRGGGKRARSMAMLRRDAKDGGDQKYFIYFHSPADVRGMAFLVWKYAQKNDDRWIFVPTLNMVRRISAQDSRSSFVGSDFNYEDVSGRDLSADTHQLKGEETLAGKRCAIVESTPKSASDYSRKVAWIDRESLLPVKEEYYDRKNTLFRVFTADKIEKKDGFWTATERTVKNLASGHTTHVTFESVSYDVGLPDDLFSERYLRNPPAKWIN
jgi:outer membrane lipoprotein-sorting protein